MIKNNHVSKKAGRAFHLAVLVAISLAAIIAAPSLTKESYAGGLGGRSGIIQECNGTECQVNMVRSTFMPETLKIRPDTTVLWTNNDKMFHTVTGGLPKDGVESLFDSGLSSPIAAGSRWEHKFDATSAGTFDYFCQIHPMMAGQIVVAGEPIQKFPDLGFMMAMAGGVFGVFAIVAAIRFKKR